MNFRYAFLTKEQYKNTKLPKKETGSKTKIFATIARGDGGRCVCVCARACVRVRLRVCVYVRFAFVISKINAL